MRHLTVLMWMLWVSSTAGAAQITEGTSKLPAVLLPRFAEFEVAPAFKGKPAAVSLVRPEERRVRTVLREGARQGPNFAGHYTVVEWGCGTECWQAAIVDAETDKVYSPPRPLTKGVGNFGSSWLHFRVNSRLLVACSNCRKWADEECDQRYVLWDGQDFTEIKRNPVHDPHRH